MGCYPPLGKIVSKALGKCNGRERWREERLDFAMAYPPGPPTQTHYMRPVARTVTFASTNSVYVIPPERSPPPQQSPPPELPPEHHHQQPQTPPQKEPGDHHPEPEPEPPQPQPQPDQPPAQTQDAPPAAQPKPPRGPRRGRNKQTRPATTARAAATAAAGGAGARAGCAAARVPVPVHAVAAAEVGGDATAARILLRGVQELLPDAGARGHLQHCHGRQPAHHHLQRGESQRLHDRLNLLSC